VGGSSFQAAEAGILGVPAPSKLFQGKIHNPELCKNVESES
jgi:hypothetical protein